MEAVAVEGFKPLDTPTGRRECALRLLEEASEACEALKRHDKAQEWETCQDALVELADVLQCVADCLEALGVTGMGFDQAIMEVCGELFVRGDGSFKPCLTDMGVN